MNKAQTKARSTVKNHFTKFIRSTKIQGMQIIVYDVLTITSKTKKSTLARLFAENFTFLKIDKNWRPVGLDQIKVTPDESKKLAPKILPWFKGAKYFVSIKVSYMGKSRIIFAIVKGNAKPGNFKTIIDPLSSSGIVLSESKYWKNSDHASKRFTNAVGGSGDFNASLEAICNGSRLRTCRGNASWITNGTTPMWHGKAEKGPITCSNNCCSMDYAFGLVFGMSDLTITYSNGDFTITAGTFSRTIYTDEGTLTDCCPVETPASSTVSIGSSSGTILESGFGEGSIHRGRIQIQGDDMNPEKSWAWVKSTPPTKTESITSLNRMYNELSTQQQRRRNQARTRAINAINNGPIDAQYYRSFYNHPRPTPTNARIDIEVIEGRAFV